MVSVITLFIYLIVKYIYYIYLKYQDPLEAVLGKPLMTNPWISW